MIAAIAALVLSGSSHATLDQTDQRPSRREGDSAPALFVWDNPGRAGQMGELATIWTPITNGKAAHQSDLEVAVALDMIEQAKCGDEIVAVIGGDHGNADGGVAGGGPNISLTLIQAPSSVVIPAQAALERVVAYLRSILADQVSLRIGVAFRSTGAPNIIGVTASRWSPQPVSPTLASMIRAGTAQGSEDDARFLPEPPAPYGTGPAANARMRVMYTGPQASNRPRYASEDRVYWTFPQLKAAWQYSLPTSTAFDAQISINTNAAIFQNLDFDPSDGVPANKYSFEDLIVRQVVQSLGWTCALSINLRQEMSVMDLYRFSADRVSLASASAAPDTGSGFMIQPTSAYASLPGCSGDCTNLQNAINAAVTAATPYTDPNLGTYNVDLNPGVMRPLRFNLVDEAFDDIADQYTFVEQFLTAPPAGSGFGTNAYGWAVRLQFGGSGIWDDSQLTPPPPPALRTVYSDGYQQQYRTHSIGTNGVAQFSKPTPVAPSPKWRSLAEGVNGAVNALLVADESSGEVLYAGGSFRSAGTAATERIARWNGTAWEALGTGLSGTVNALAAFDGDLYAGGTFRQAGSLEVNYIAVWNGSAWSALGKGLNNAVHALAVHDDGSGEALYVGGSFTEATFTDAGGTDVTVIANRIARWDGSEWSAVGDSTQDPSVLGFDGPVTALAVYEGELVAGGSFSLADNSSVVSNIAAWNGSTWLPLGTGANGQVRCLTNFDGSLAAGGDFTDAGGVAANRIASWNGTVWANLGTGANASVRALTAFDDGTSVTLGAGGEFTTLGGLTTNYVGVWDGTAWSALEGGLLCTVNALEQLGTDATWAPIAGGAFSGNYCVLVDYQAQYPGYMPRLVATGLADGLVNLNFVTGIDNDPTNSGPNGVDFEVPILSNQATFTSFLVQAVGAVENQYLMGGQQLPQATTYFSRSGVTGAPCNPTGDFLSPTELKILNCLGWAVNPVPTADDCE